VVLDEIRREVGAILTEMNQATERNIELIEDRVGRLQQLLDQADRKLGGLRRETARKDDSEQLYARLGRSAASMPPTGPVPSPEVPQAQPGSAEPTPPNNTVETQDQASRLGAETGQPRGESPAPEDRDHGSEPVSVKARVLEMYRQGFALERIASRVGTAISEVELIVSLSDGRGDLGYPD